MIVIFLSNKLVSADTVAPLLLEVRKKHPKTKIKIYVIDRQTYDILNKNKFLASALRASGDLEFIGRARKRAYLAERFDQLVWLFGLILRSYISKVTFIHFGVLDDAPLSYIARLFKGPKILMAGSSWYYHKNEHLSVNHASFKRSARKIVHGDYRVGFQEDWPGFKKQDGVDILMPPPRSLETWLDYVRQRSEATVSAELKRFGQKTDSKIILVLLGYFGPLEFLRSESSVQDCFKELLRALKPYSAKYPILLKPHAITNVEIVERYLDELEMDKAFITHLHPAVLATRACICATNYFSTAQADAKMMGVPVVEYTEYTQEYLDLLEGNAMNPMYTDFAIQRDTEKLGKILSEVFGNEIHIAPSAPSNGSSVNQFIDLLEVA